jgi:hypothetical protein
MTKIAAIATAIALTLSAQGFHSLCRQHYRSEDFDDKTARLCCAEDHRSGRRLLPTIAPVTQKTFSGTGFGSGTWQSVQATPVNPVTGLHASDVSRLTFSPNGTFTDYIVSEGGTGLGPNQTGAGGLIIITGKDKLLSNSSIQLTESSEHICTGLGCINDPTSLIGKPFTKSFSAISPGVVNGGGVTWTKVQSAY